MLVFQALTIFILLSAWDEWHKVNTTNVNTTSETSGYEAATCRIYILQADIQFAKFRPKF